MNVSTRMSREVVSLAALDDDALSHEMDDRAKVRRFARAMRIATSVPPLFVIRQGGKLSLIQGSEQTAAADRLGIDELEAVIFDAHSDVEADIIGAVGFDLAESGRDVWAGLQQFDPLQRAA